MSYLKHSLGENESLIATGRFSWLYRAAALGILLIAFGGAGFLLIALNAQIFSALAVGLGVAVALAVMIPIWTTEIGVTNQQLVIKRGLLTRRTEEVELWSIEEVDLEQGLLGRLFNFGRIIIQGTGDDEMRLPAIADPLEFRKAIQTAISRVTQAGRLRQPPEST
jgi:uncharacterized membrane protein YdbT with pleckstrin-like domain